jgi:hypothetical protein
VRPLRKAPKPVSRVVQKSSARRKRLSHPDKQAKQRRRLILSNIQISNGFCAGTTSEKKKEEKKMALSYRSPRRQLSLALPGALLLSLFCLRPAAAALVSTPVIDGTPAAVQEIAPGYGAISLSLCPGKESGIHLWDQDNKVFCSLRTSKSTVSEEVFARDVSALSAHVSGVTSFVAVRAHYLRRPGIGHKCKESVLQLRLATQALSGNEAIGDIWTSGWALRSEEFQGSFTAAQLLAPNFGLGLRVTTDVTEVQACNVSAIRLELVYDNGVPVTTGKPATTAPPTTAVVTTTGIPTAPTTDVPTTGVPPTTTGVPPTTTGVPPTTTGVSTSVPGVTVAGTSTTGSTTARPPSTTAPGGKSPSSNEAGSASDAGSATPIWVWALIGVAALCILLVIAAVFLVRRRSHPGRAEITSDYDESNSFEPQDHESAYAKTPDFAGSPRGESDYAKTPAGEEEVNNYARTPVGEEEATYARTPDFGTPEAEDAYAKTPADY